jgi:hypothetical protein
MDRKSIRFLPVLLLLGLGIIFALQVVQVWKDYAHIQLYLTKTYGRIQSVERSEILMLGFHEAEYVRFLDAIIPADAPVVLPGDDSGLFSQQSILQYYLFPRIIWPCDGTCQSFAADTRSFILAMDGFPPEALIGGKTLIPYPEGGRFLGVYAPAEEAVIILASGIPTIPGTQNFPWTAPFVDLLTLVLCVLPGVLLVLIMLKRPGWDEIGMFSMPIGFGMLSWLVFLANYLGWSITLIHVAILLGILLTGLAVLLYLQRKTIAPISLPRPETFIQRIRQDPIQAFLVFALLGWFGMVLLISVGRAYSVFDDIVNWALKGYATAYQGTIWAGQIWGGHVMAYPMNLQLSIAFFDLTSGDTLPGSKLLFPLYALVLILGCLRFLRRNGVDSRLGLATALVFVSVPLVFFHSTIGMANLPFTSLLVLAILTQLEAVEEGQVGKQVLSGLLYGLAAWTRPEGIGFSFAFLLAVFALTRWLLKIPLNWRAVLRVVLPLVVIPGTWLLLVGGRGLGSDQVGGALSSAFGAGSVGAALGSALIQILRSVWALISESGSAGWIVPTGLIFLVGAYVLKRKTFPVRVILLLILFLLAVLLPMAMFAVAVFSESDFQVFLQVSLDRAMLPALALFWLAAVLSIGKPVAPAENKFR